jgi:hypothetical protein
MSRSLGEAWESAASDPNPNTDLGYELRQLTVIELEERNGGTYMFLPGEADHLHDDEFLLATSGSVCQLEECR